MDTLYLSDYCHILKGQVYKNGQLIFEDADAGSLATFLKSVYRHFKPKYPKFFKMDEISKLGFMAAEVLLTDGQHQAYDGDEVGMVLANSHATLVTDRNFQKTINDYDQFFPSPSVFVYTLPNIMIGEISIKNKLRGENAFFIFEHFNAEFITDYINQLIADSKIKACIGGWVNQSPDDYEAFLYWVEGGNKGGVTHTATEIVTLLDHK